MKIPKVKIPELEKTPNLEEAKPEVAEPKVSSELGFIGHTFVDSVLNVTLSILKPGLKFDDSKCKFDIGEGEMPLEDFDLEGNTVVVKHSLIRRDETVQIMYDDELVGQAFKVGAESQAAAD